MALKSTRSVARHASRNPPCSSCPTPPQSAPPIVTATASVKLLLGLIGLQVLSARARQVVEGGWCRWQSDPRLLELSGSGPNLRKLQIHRRRVLLHSQEVVAKVDLTPMPKLKRSRSGRSLHVQICRKNSPLGAPVAAHHLLPPHILAVSCGVCCHSPDGHDEPLSTCSLLCCSLKVRA